MRCARCEHQWRPVAEHALSEGAENGEAQEKRPAASSQPSSLHQKVFARDADRDAAARGQERRVALVVGNGKYQKTSWLANPPNDAEKMVAALGWLGFSVLDGTNLDYASFAGRVRDFGRALREAHVALFFYAGHGLQVRGENYVVPVDASLEHEADVQLELIAVQTILASMEIGNRTSIVILDACRDNPLARNLARSMRGTRPAEEIGRGLGRLESGIGTYIAFATSPNKLASDGVGAANSPFTAALLKYIETPGLAITDIMMQVRRDVIAATEKTREGAQVPWDNSSLLAPFYFLRPRSGMTQGAPAPDPAVVIDPAERDWERWQIAETEELAIIEAYIAKYAASEPIWSARARQRLEVAQALIAEREDQSRRQRERREVDEKRRREEEQEAEFRAKGLVEMEAWTPKGQERRWIEPGAGRDGRHMFRDFGHGPEMVLVPAGEFLMGAPEGEEGRSSDEGPQHKVTIPAPFAIGRYAVTFAEWDAFVAAGGGYRPDDRGWGRGDRPVINVSWQDAQAYLTWLRQATGQEYRLPSEAEWEYVARAGTTTPFWWGASISTTQANFNSNYTYGGAQKGEYRKQTLPVKSFEPNPWGLYQVHGNVVEWCEDAWHESYADKPGELIGSGGPWDAGGDSARVLRGGSWYGNPRILRSAFRFRYTPGFRNDDFGLRVARRDSQNFCVRTGFVMRV